jgi:hypothetical protein
MAFRNYSLRRRFPRVASENAILVKRKRDRGPGEVLSTRVIGLGGCMFVHEGPLGVGVSLELSILVGLRLANLNARVVYQNPQRDSIYQIGVEFIDPSPKDLDILLGLVCSAVH